MVPQPDEPPPSYDAAVEYTPDIPHATNKKKLPCDLMPLKHGCRQNVREKQLIRSVTRKLLGVSFFPYVAQRKENETDKQF